MKFEAEPEKFLGINIWRDRIQKQIAINQYDYIMDMIDRYGPTPANQRFNVPITPEFEHEPNESDELMDVKSYQELVGSIMHATTTRKDISYAASIAAIYMSKPKSKASRKNYVYSLKMI
ncbi:hypothetical protein HK100_010844 [Physocladia obscura]|uniref:Uncharacterized protein n=1 Tax=Physocladia obscura TaxID=109957 RepID=A0AAD5X6U8_9FUNG|nr:hypothetical protein HK100_010844 [Physocladia obscura]